MQRIGVIFMVMACAAFGVAAWPIHAAARQAAPVTDPAFDVVSIRRNTSGTGAPTSRVEGSRYIASNLPLQQLIADAYRLPVSGGPAWIRSTPGPVQGAGDVRFDVIATIPRGAPPSRVPVMLRRALAERFKLVAHVAAEPRPVYALVLARDDKRLGMNLTRSTQQCQLEIDAGPLRAPVRRMTADGKPECGMTISPGAIRGGGLTLRFLANALNGPSGRTVVDRTGLEGPFDFDVRYAPSGRGGAPPLTSDDRPAIFVALPEQLGLKLEPSVEPVESLVIDEVSMPSEN